MITTDYEYAVRALAWAVVWSAAGLSVRKWLSDREDERHEHERGRRS